MPAESAEYLDPLSVLGRVDPPTAAVLNNAREALWAVVAAAMLSDTGASDRAANRDVEKEERRQAEPGS